MAEVVKTNPSAILTKIVAALRAEDMALDPDDDSVLTNLSEAQVIVVAANAKPPNLVGGRDLLLRYGVRVPLVAKEQGGGRSGLRLLFRLDIFGRLAQSTDETGSNQGWLRTADAYSDAVLNLMLQFRPTDADANFYTEEGFRILALGAPNKNDAQWGDFVLTFEAEYRPNIDPTRDLPDHYAGR